MCPSIYTGNNCERLQEQCTGIECLNNGRCVKNGTRFMCSCTDGYHGDNCEFTINYCESQPVRKNSWIELKKRIRNLDHCCCFFFFLLLLSVKMVEYVQIQNQVHNVLVQMELRVQFVKP